MLLKNRLFKRQEPSREAKSIFIFCEGKKREYQYFSYFKEIDSRINIEIYELDPNEDNSPKGLLKIAEENILVTDNREPKYDFQEETDEVWLVFDTDKDDFNSRKKQIEKIYSTVSKRKNWFAAQSNPCFEVWLFYHKNKSIPKIDNIEKCVTWKDIVNTSFSGGFDSRKHPIYFNKAIKNSKENFKKENDELMIGSTEVYILAESINKIISEKIKKIFKNNS